jgi:hypothetical protein
MFAITCLSFNWTFCNQKLGCRQHFLVTKMKKKMGRPKLPTTEAKGAQYAVRLAKADADAVNRAIKHSGKSKPDWLRNALLTAAQAGNVAP